jgi:hypothetical protein
MHTRAQTALLSPGADITALRGLFEELLREQSTVRHIADLMAGADISYDTSGAGPAHAMAGRWMPDIALRTGNGPTRIAGLLRAARPILLTFADRADLADAAKNWAARVAWAADSGTPRPADGLRRALQTWFGAAVPC